VTCQSRNLFSEGPHRAHGVDAEEAAHRQTQLHQTAGDRQIGQPTLIPRMHSSRRGRALRAALLIAANRGMKNNTIVGLGDLTDLQAVKMRQ
jgi:hypothetical protein